MMYVIAAMWIAILVVSCTKQDTLKCYSGEIGNYERVECPVRS